MTYYLTLFDRDHQEMTEVEHYFLAAELIAKGHPVKQEFEYHSGINAEILIRAWMEFETMEEMVIFKLTHL